MRRRYGSSFSYQEGTGYDDPSPRRFQGMPQEEEATIEYVPDEELQPDDEIVPDDEVRRILGPPPEAQEFEAEEFDASPFDQFLERYGAGGGIQLQRPPQNFLEGLLYGAGQGFAGRGQRIAKQREKFDAAQSTRMAQRNRENLEASRKYDERKFQLERDALQNKRTKTDRGALVQIDTPQGPRYVTRDEAIGKAPPKQDKTPEAEPLVEVLGPDGDPMWVRRSDAVGKKSPRAKEKDTKPSTGLEKTALGFYLRMDESLKTITGGEPGASLEDGLSQADKIGLAKSPDWALNPRQRMYRQAQRTFTEARLRKESGAAIPPYEYENDARIYFAQPGDDPGTIAQKRAARTTVQNGLKFQSGSAYNEYFGEGGQGAAPPGSAASRLPQIPEIPPTWKRVP